MMKSFLRSLRSLFGGQEKEKEPEIQIGAPTDVKHVAHIGCDGPSTPAPSWMNEYKGGSDSQSGETNVTSRDLGSSGGISASPGDPQKAKQSRRSSNGQESSNHKSRKNKSSNGESSTNETSVKKTRKKQGEGSTRPSRTRNKDLSTTDSGCSDEVCKKST
ncbi:hypothetical protein M8C21_000947 [Ambrosia artemisiifolia]|uniref:CRIB domain-containing protein n=1 Tax=Ambrosia artemisiifolia TaxID=4212 RepID=A0AAD5C1H2_AMBAR|nr:hypothetical protein M8C21_000947 [Ambrosia artemisiifolia]